MSKTPVEENFVTRIILGLVVIYAMIIAGGAVGESLSSVNRYAAWIGFAVGAVFVFGSFTVAYYQYSQSYDAE